VAETLNTHCPAIDVFTLDGLVQYRAEGIIFYFVFERPGGWRGGEGWLRCGKLREKKGEQEHYDEPSHKARRVLRSVPPARQHEITAPTSP
jgi:hypothetical protein